MSMQRFVTGSRQLRPLRPAAVAAPPLIVAAVALSGAPAYAVNPPGIDPAAVPPDSPPGPSATMKQSSYCTEVGVLPGSDFRVQPKYMDMLNLPEAWRFGRGAGVRIAVIDTGVTPHPRLPHLIPGGDYVMGGGDGLSDCDAHGTLVASMIAASPGSAGIPEAPGPRRPPPVPTREPPPVAPPPQTISVAPPPPQTITMVPAPPASQSEEAPACPWCPPAPKAPGSANPAPGGANQAPGAANQAPGAANQAPGAANHGHGKAVLPGFPGGKHGQVVSVDYPRPAAPPLDPPPLPAPSDAYSGIAPDVELN